MLGLSCIQVEMCLIASERVRSLGSSPGDRRAKSSRCRLSPEALGRGEVSRRAVRAGLLRGCRRKEDQDPMREAWGGQENVGLPQSGWREGGSQGLPHPPITPEPQGEDNG